MTNEMNTPQRPQAAPAIVDRATFQAELDTLRVREKAHMHAGDAIATARRRLPMVEVDATATLVGPDGPLTLLDAFEGRRLALGLAPAVGGQPPELAHRRASNRTVVAPAGRPLRPSPGLRT